MPKCNCCGQELPSEDKITFDGKHFVGISNADISDWIEKYHPVDPDIEIPKMEAWLETNPTKRKKLYKRFICKWLNRASEKATRVKSTPRDGLL